MPRSSLCFTGILCSTIIGCGHRAPVDVARSEQDATARLPLENDEEPDQRLGKSPFWSGEERDARTHADAAAFLLASGGAPIVIDFDSAFPEANYSNRSEFGVTFVRVGAPLLVVHADETIVDGAYENVRDPESYRLLATSGKQVLSPGGALLVPGPAPETENDDVTMIFDPPVACVGFDVLTPSSDGMSFVDVTIIAVDGSTLYTGRVEMPHLSATESAFPPPGHGFFGFVSRERNIREVRIDDLDDNAVCPDSNIGIDTIRFAPAAAWQYADLDGSGTVDQFDARELMRQLELFGDEEQAPDLWRSGDLNRDHVIDSTDLMILGSYMGSVGG